jgi:23S rRNA (cytosine1962-C5)-methyltransferase
VLSDEPLFVIINSYTTGLAPSVLSYMLGEHIHKSGSAAAKATSWACR